MESNEEIKVRYVIEADLPSIVDVANRADIPRSLDWYKRCLFSHSISPGDDPGERGAFAVTNDGRAVCVQLHHPVYLYLKQAKRLCFQREVLACDIGYGGYLSDVLDLCTRGESGHMAFNNCIANMKSLKVAKFSGWKSGPGHSDVEMFSIMDLWSYVIYAILMRGDGCNKALLRVVRFAMTASRLFCSFLHKLPKDVVKLTNFSSDEYKSFWEAYLKSNQGYVSDRSPDVMTRLFEHSMNEGDVVFFCKMDDERRSILGMLGMRRYPLRGDIVKYEILDVIALNNDVRILTKLFSFARNFVYLHEGVRLGLCTGNSKLRMVAKRFLAHDKKLAAPAYAYAIGLEDDELLCSEKSWFFLPFDGERCLGHGMYID